jgi:hypothetical protein
LGRGDTRHAAHKTDDALEAFQINLDPNCQDYRKFGLEVIGVLNEYVRAVRLFKELHGDIPVEKITRAHARTCTLTRQKLTSKTVNKLFGGVQTIARWAFKNGMVPDDVQWSDPFATMRLDEDALGGHHSLCLN